MKQVVLVGGARTAIGRHGGAFKDIPAQDLAARVFEEVLNRTQLDPALIDEVVLGCIGQSSDAPNIGRVAALMAGVPKEVPGYTYSVTALRANKPSQALSRPYRQRTERYSCAAAWRACLPRPIWCEVPDGG